MEILTGHYSPLGMTLGGLDYYSALYNDYLYQGKELQNDGFDLQGGDDVLDTKLLWHDFHARFYDAQLGRFHVPDPIINEASPYVGMMNNPVIITDPSGMTPGGDDKYKDHPTKSKVIDDNQGWSIDFGVIIDWFKSWWAGGSGNNSGSSSFGNWRDDFSYDLENYSGETSGSNTFHGTGTNGGIFYTSTSNGGGAYFWLIALGIDVDWYLAEGRKTALRKEINKIKPLIAKAVSYNQPVIDAPPERPLSPTVPVPIRVKYNSELDRMSKNVENVCIYNKYGSALYATYMAYPTYNNDFCGWCAKKVRLAIQFGGGINTDFHPVSAANAHYYLLSWGFYEVTINSFIPYNPQIGDIRVWPPTQGGSKHGHMDIWNGSNWVSDFIQKGFYPGKAYELNNAPFSAYRYRY